jgi:hypothetical protein
MRMQISQCRSSLKPEHAFVCQYQQTLHLIKQQHPGLKPQVCGWHSKRSCHHLLPVVLVLQTSQLRMWYHLLPVLFVL